MKPMNHWTALPVATLFTALLSSPDLLARPSVQVKSAVDRLETPGGVAEAMILPFAFSADSTGLVAGVGGMRKGFYQDQMLIGGAAYGGEDSYGGFLGVWDYRFEFSKRTFISASGMRGYYPKHRAYAFPHDIFLPPQFDRPGSNESSEDAYQEASGDSNWWEIKLDYVLPLGAAREQAIMQYQLSGGILVSEPTGGDGWNPLESGVTIGTLRHYNRYQSYEYERGTFDGDLHAFELGLLYDNTDYPINPTRGSSQYVAVHHDPNWGDSSDDWSFLEVEASKYLSLGSDSWASQRILALNAWTAYSPSWEIETDAQGGQRVQNGPPFLEGASLGGFYRMRGYNDSRFHDKAAVYAAAEYRYTLRYNPIENIQWLHFMRLDWFQLVGFVEGGRVSPTYQPSTLFDDWKADVGFGVRALTAGIVVRFDMGFSEEGANAWVMVGHPF